MKTIYHVSKTPNLKVLEPKLCSHSKAYVYASYYLEKLVGTSIFIFDLTYFL